MKIRFYIIAILLLFGIFTKGQTIDYPYYECTFTTVDGYEWEGIIFQAKDSALVLTHKSNWRNLKGRKAELSEVYPRLKISRGVDWKTSSFSYDNLGIVMVNKKDKKWGGAPLIGLGIGLTGGYVLSEVEYYMRCLHDAGEEPFCEKKPIIKRNMLIGSALGLLIGVSLKIRTTKERHVKEIENKEWQQALIEYAILK